MAISRKIKILKIVFLSFFLLVINGFAFCEPVDTTSTTAHAHPTEIERQQLHKSRAAFAKAKAGLRNAKILVIGDSISAGLLSGSYTEARKTAWPTLLATTLQAAGSSSSTWGGITANTFMFNAANTNTASDNARYDPRMKFGPNWKARAYDPNKGSWHIYYENDSASTVTFTPDSANCCDTYDFYYYADAAQGVITFGDTATPTTIDESTTSGMTKATIRLKSVGALTITPPTSKAVNIQAVHGYMYARPEITIFNTSINGFGAGNFIYKGASSQQALLRTIAPDLTIICIGVNDMAAPVERYFGSMQNIIKAMQVSGDVLLLTPPPANPSTIPLITQTTFINAMKSLAQKNNFPIINLWESWNPWAAYNDAGYYYDNIHPRLKGYQEMANAVAQFLLPLINESSPNDTTGKSTH